MTALEKSTKFVCSAGRPVQEMWGAQWNAYAEEAADHGTLQLLPHADLSPARALLDACVLSPLREMVRFTPAACLGCEAKRYNE